MPNDSSSPVAAAKANKVTQDSKWKALVALLAVAGLYFASQIVSGSILYLYPSLKGWTDIQTAAWLKDSVFAQFFFVLMAEALMVGAIFGLIKAFGWTRRRIGLTWPTIKHLLLGVAAVVPYLILLVVAVNVAQHFFPALNVNQQQQIGFSATPHHSMLELVLVFVSLVVLPPLVEEITMRGFLYSGLRVVMPKFIAALVVSVVFGLPHLAQGGDAGPLWIAFIDTFILSMVLVWLREQTGNLWAGITLHAIKNGIAFVSLFILSVR
jgi:membrane protease YdiL (CAAX protease family)